MKILLVPSVDAAALEHARLLAARLTIAGLDVETSVFNPDNPAKAPVDASRLALVVPMGGDGTYLHAAHLIDFTPVPILGFNYGDLGFLSGNPARDEVELIVDALAGELAVERRSTLDAVVTDGSGAEHEFTALNEIAYTRGVGGHVVRYTLGVNGTDIATLKADGLVVATATGSTAYALSAGGPILSPAYNGLVAVPLAPHSLSTRAVVTAPSDVVEVALSGRALDDASVFVDGRALDVHGARHILVRRGEREVLYVRGGDDFFASVAHVFFGGGEQSC